MLAEEWERIKLIFESALRVPPGERRAFVERECGSSPQVAAIVWDLIENHQRAGEFLEHVSLRLGTVFAAGDLVAGRFRVRRFINAGGMGEVYEVFDERLRERVALKTLRRELIADEQARGRFEREIRISRDIAHEGVCQVFDLVDHAAGDEVIPCLTMRLIEGESLLTHLSIHRPLPVETALLLLRQIGSALDALHRCGIIHRDLKPSNIMLVRREGSLRAVVTDFGLAKPSAPVESDFFESRVDSQAGAPYFMAPELLRGERPSPASDIYSLALIADEMVTTSRAFDSESIQSLYYQKLWEQPAAPADRAASLPAAWNAAILRCLDTDPAVRFATAEGFVEYLGGRKRIAAPIAVDSEVPRTSASAPARRLFGRRMRVCAIAVGIVLGAAAAAGHFVDTPERTSVVVFPVEYGNPNPEYLYLSRGITAELIRRLGLMENLTILPHHEPRQAGENGKLKGRYALEGLLQVVDGKLRLNGQLTDNADGSLVWSESFEQELRNPLQLQSDIAQSAVQAIGHRTGAGSGRLPSFAYRMLPPSLAPFFGMRAQALPKAITTNADAFSAYIRGEEQFEERSIAGALGAIVSFEQALRCDPEFALAYAGLADAQLVLNDFEYLPTAVLADRAKRYAERAVGMDSHAAETWTTLGAVRQMLWDFRGSKEAYLRAVENNPRYARGHRWYAGILMQYGRFDEGLAELRRSMELDPYDYSGEGNLCSFLFFAHRFEDAGRACTLALEHKDSINSHLVLGDSLYFRAEKAVSPEREKLLAMAAEQAQIVRDKVIKGNMQIKQAVHQRSIKFSDRMQAMIYWAQGRADLAAPIVERLAADVKDGSIAAYSMAQVYAGQGKVDDAFRMLRQSVAQRDRQLLFFRVTPYFDRISSDPRFDAIVREMKLSGTL